MDIKSVPTHDMRSTLSLAFTANIYPMMSTNSWRTSETVLNWCTSLVTRPTVKEEPKQQTDWNDWLGQAGQDRSRVSEVSRTAATVFEEVKLRVWDKNAHQIGWIALAPASALTVSKIVSALSSSAIPVVSTVFAVMPSATTPLGQIAQLGSSILLMLSIKGLGSHETSKRGNYLGIAGVSAAVLTVVLSNWTTVGGLSPQFFWFLPVAALGQYIGISVARAVQMEQLPELVAGFHSLTGLAAVLVGIASQLGSSHSSSVAKMIETFLGVSVGAATFSGSIAAAAKLNGLIGGGPIGLNYRFIINSVSVANLGLLFAAFIGVSSPGLRVAALCGNTLVSLVLGTMLVLPVGGSDIPIVISFLNAMSGLATSATGFSMDNSLLVMTGALVASSGTLLSEIMCKGINRSLTSVLMGGFGVDTSVANVASSSSAPEEITTITVQQMVTKLQQAKRVLVIPGYGMAVARCQAGVSDIFTELKQRGVDVVFGIHPVAGRLPGHMNVILSEADIPYDVVKELEEVNEEMTEFDIAIVLGANDIVNPATATDPSSPIYGMPAIECWRAKHVVVMKRSMNTGYSGVDNPLFYLENTSMLFGDAKATVDKIHVGVLESDISEWPNASNTDASGVDQTISKAIALKQADAAPSIDFAALPVFKSIGALQSGDSGKEKRIPISPKVCVKLRQMGFQVLIPSGFGDSCGWSDSVFEKFGAKIVSERTVLEQCDVILKVTPLTDAQLAYARPPEEVEKKQILITSFAVDGGMDALLSKLASRQLTTFNLNLVPRISRAQSMDILSSMANLAGYKATINAFYRIGKLSRSSVTAGGTIPAARVFVIGCGVAGLSAVATAHALGATVLATDVRPATKEQVESIGATFVEVPSDESLAENGGYASEVSASFAERQKALYRDITATADVVITTAMVPGRKSPVLLSAEMVRQMKPGSIIVDMAAASGGNCELVVPDEIITDEESGVLIDGTTNYANELPQLSSELFSQNCLAFIENLCSKKVDASSLAISTDDVIVRQSLIMLESTVMYPPPAMPPQAAPGPSSQSKLTIAASVAVPHPLKWKHADDALLVAGAVGLGTLGLAADHKTVRLVGDFVLSCVIGHFTVSSVTPALHTPLISVTNAVSGIIVVGGMLEIDQNVLSAKSLCALTAVMASIVNVSGGFAITDRMLSMFKSQNRR